ncbi:MAG: prephenate dehydratase [Syntrophus sp. (in: bacteria)]|nr:prephenate dehydratase [Syntrophus sp. (in: bacteria)]
MAMAKTMAFFIGQIFIRKEYCMDTEGMRKRIDLIDYQIMTLLNQRMEFGLRLKKLKEIVNETGQTEENITAIKGTSRGMIRSAFAEALFAEIIGESALIQEQDLKLIGFQGEHGAFSEEASYAYDPALIPIPYRDFDEIFEEVRTGTIDFAIVPVENSLGGPVTPVNDLLIESDLKISGEITMPIHHCLLVLPDMDYRDLKTVYSHSRALAQCRTFISRHKIEPRPYYDTAGSAKMLSENRPAAAGAIAGRLCAELYHLEVLKENIEDHPLNSTRFNVISRYANPEPGNKCSIAFTVRHETGSLLEILKTFSDGGINLAKIDSRPMKDDPGEYRFLADFEGSDRDERVIRTLRRIEENTIMFKFLGCYKS